MDRRLSERTYPDPAYRHPYIDLRAALANAIRYASANCDPDPRKSPPCEVSRRDVLHNESGDLQR